jgi:Asp-tRNA(Asn)/Glu-tRNA(Gln) amidotransferase A subunit family amidase
VLPDIEQGLDSHVAAACAERRAGLIAAGHLPPAAIARIDPAELDAWANAFRVRQAHEAWRCHGRWIAAHPGALGPDIAARFAAGARVTATQAERAAAVVATARAKLRTLLDGAVLAMPSTAGGAPDRDSHVTTIDNERTATLRLTILAGLAGAPALSLPFLHTPEGRPVGLCLVGAPGRDHDLLDVAAAF